MYTPEDPNNSYVPPKRQGCPILDSFPSHEDPAKKLLIATKRIGREFGDFKVIVTLAEALTTYNVSTTPSAEEAIDTIVRGNIDVLVLDAFVDGPDYAHKLGTYEEFPAHLRDGLWALDQIKDIKPSQRVMMIIDDVLNLEAFCMLRGTERVFTIPYCGKPLFDYLIEKDPAMKRIKHAINE